MDIVRFVIRSFVLHVSIAKPLGENGKLQLTSDMTELEFALSAFMVDNPQSKRGGNLESVGEEYRILRAMRSAFSLFSCREGARITASQTALVLGQCPVGVTQAHCGAPAFDRVTPHPREITDTAPT